MISINNINISNDGSSLNVNISTGVGYIITEARLWTENTYKDYTLVKDLGFKLEQINNKEIFTVTAEEVNLSNFNGIYFLEFETDEPLDEECNTCANPLLVVVTNLNQYYRCMSELVLQADICNTNLFSREVCDDNAVNKALTINLFMDTINQCLELGQFVEAIDLMKNLKKLCDKCKSCKKITKHNNSCSSCNQYNTYI